MKEVLLIIFDGLKRLFLLLLVLSVIISMNYAFCDGKRLNENTKKIEKQTDSIKKRKLDNKYYRFHGIR